MNAQLINNPRNLIQHEIENLLLQQRLVLTNKIFCPTTTRVSAAFCSPETEAKVTELRLEES
jgi:hypothetical protein